MLLSISSLRNRRLASRAPPQSETPRELLLAIIIQSCSERKSHFHWETKTNYVWGEKGVARPDNGHRHLSRLRFQFLRVHFPFVDPWISSVDPREAVLIMRLLSVLLCSSILLVLFTHESSASFALRRYQERIKAMREAINARQAEKTALAVGEISKISKTNPQKTKRYKCILVEDDDDTPGAMALEPPKVSLPEVPDFDDDSAQVEMNEKLWPALSSLPKQTLKPKTIRRPMQPKPVDINHFEFPKARAMPHTLPVVESTQQPPVITTVTTVKPNVPTDPNGQPLILSPEHCSQIKHYSNMYGVTDVKAWVHNNCAFAKMYLPKATCAEIDVLVSSCYDF
uniref:INCENP_ARK-bind domain-containing protein n=1 Tax=Steinernema glaseri TaxID=37863 RepID=A0A1I8AE43_9BILA